MLRVYAKKREENKGYEEPTGSAVITPGYNLPAKIAVETVVSFLEEYDQFFDCIIFNVFKDMDKEYYEQLLGT